MFGRMRFVVKVNAALARMDVDPREIPSQARQTMQDLGRQSGLTSEETAVLLVEQVPDDQLPLAVTSAKHLSKWTWEMEGKYRPDRVSAIREALEKAGQEHDAAVAEHVRERG